MQRPDAMCSRFLTMFEMTKWNKDYPFRSAECTGCSSFSHLLAISPPCGLSALYVLSTLRRFAFPPLSYGLCVGVSAGEGLSLEFAGFVIEEQQSKISIVYLSQLSVRMITADLNCALVRNDIADSNL
jgi:hypothetical protein